MHDGRYANADSRGMYGGGRKDTENGLLGGMRGVNGIEASYGQWSAWSRKRHAWGTHPSSYSVIF